MVFSGAWRFSNQMIIMRELMVDDGDYQKVEALIVIKSFNQVIKHINPTCLFIPSRRKMMLMIRRLMKTWLSSTTSTNLKHQEPRVIRLMIRRCIRIF